MQDTGKVDTVESLNRIALSDQQWSVIVSEIQTAKLGKTEQRIAQAKRSKADGRGRYRRLGMPAGRMLRQLIFWDARPKKLTDHWIYKTRADWREEAGLDRSAVETARKVLVAEKLIEAEPGRDPYTNNLCWHYRLRPLAIMNLLDPDRAEVIARDAQEGQSEDDKAEVETLEAAYQREELVPCDEARESTTGQRDEKASTSGSPVGEIHADRRRDSSRPSARLKPTTEDTQNGYTESSFSPDKLEHVSETARSHVIVDGKQEREAEKRTGDCVDALSPALDADFKIATLPDLFGKMDDKYPNLDPLAVSRHIAENAKEPIRTLRYIEIGFEMAEKRRLEGDESNAASPYEKRKRSEDKPKRADWYETYSEVTIDRATVQGWIDAGMGDAAIMARLESAAA